MVVDATAWTSTVPIRFSQGGTRSLARFPPAGANHGHGHPEIARDSAVGACGRLGSPMSLPEHCQRGAKLPESFYVTGR